MPIPHSPTRQPERWRNLSQTLLLVAIWLLLSGHYTILLLALGALSVALTSWVVARMDVVDREGHPLHLAKGLPIYCLWLLKEVIISNWAVIKKILRPGRHPVLPAVATVDSSALGTVGQVIYANSITLTPGTVTIDIHCPDPNQPENSQRSRLQVHALSSDSLDELAEGIMAERVQTLAGNQ